MIAAQPSINRDSAAPPGERRDFEQFGLEQSVNRVCAAEQVMQSVRWLDSEVKNDHKRHLGKNHID